MKISIEEVSRVLEAQGVAPKRTPNGNGSGNGTNGHAAPAASVEISPRAQEIARVRAEVQAAPEVREDLVESIRARLEAGEYRVSSEDIADLMLRRAYADRVR